MEDGPESAVAGNDALDQFRDWLAWQSDIERKRALLKNLASVPFSTTTQFPRLVDDLQSDRCLVYQRQQGEPLAERLRSEKSAQAALDLWTESLLEQSLLLSLMDSEARPENYLLLPVLD